MKTDWHQKAIDALQLNGLSERTQQAYVRALRMLCELYHKSPDEISEPELQQYLGHAQLETTMAYLHLTHAGQEDAYAVPSSWRCCSSMSCPKASGEHGISASCIPTPSARSACFSICSGWTRAGRWRGLSHAPGYSAHAAGPK